MNGKVNGTHIGPCNVFPSPASCLSVQRFEKSFFGDFAKSRFVIINFLKFDPHFMELHGQIVKDRNTLCVFQQAVRRGRVVRQVRLAR